MTLRYERRRAPYGKDYENVLQVRVRRRARGRSVWQWVDVPVVPKEKR